LQANSSNPQQYRPPQADIYTVLLAIALWAVIVGCVFLFLEVADYGSPPYPEGGVTVQSVLETADGVAMAAVPPGSVAPVDG